MPAQLCSEVYKYNKGLCNFHTGIFLYNVLTQFLWSYVTRVLHFGYYKAYRKSKAKRTCQWHSGFVCISFLPPCVKIFLLLYLTTFINMYSKLSCFGSRTWKWRTSRLATNVTAPVTRVCPYVRYTWRRHPCVFLIWMKAWTYISDLSDSREKHPRQNKG